MGTSQAGPCQAPTQLHTPPLVHEAPFWHVGLHTGALHSGPLHCPVQTQIGYEADTNGHKKQGKMLKTILPVGGLNVHVPRLAPPQLEGQTSASHSVPEKPKPFTFGHWHVGPVIVSAHVPRWHGGDMVAHDEHAGDDERVNEKMTERAREGVTTEPEAI